LHSSEMGANLVVGTTGISADQLSRMRAAIDGKVAAVISPNFSVGVNMFWKLIAVAAEALQDYDIEVIEAHHNQKKDAPSGTALATVEVIKKALGDVDVVYGREGIRQRGKGDRGARRPGRRYRRRSHCALRRTRGASGDQASSTQPCRLCLWCSARGPMGGR